MFKYTDSGVDYSEDYKDAALKLFKGATDIITGTYHKALEHYDIGSEIDFEVEDVDGTYNWLTYQIDSWKSVQDVTDRYIKSMQFYKDALPMVFKLLEEEYDLKGVSSDFLKERYKRCCSNIRDILDVTLSGRNTEQGPFVAFTTLCLLVKVADTTIRKQSRIKLSLPNELPDFFVSRELKNTLSETADSFLNSVG